MKKILIIVTAMLLVAGVAFGASIVGSKHDLSGAAGGQLNQICAFCHTPHNASTSTTVSGAPLWAHSITVAGYTLYSSATLNGTATQPSGVSRACLSCHDGTIAVGGVAYGRSAGSYAIPAAFGRGAYAAGGFITGGALLDTNLSNDHPVSITYANASDAGLRAPTGSQVINGSVTAQLFGTAPYTVECASCHNVHDNANTPFLRASNNGSALCLTCHLK